MATALLLAGGAWAMSTAPKRGGTLTVADPLAPTTLDPIAGASGGDAMSLYPIFDRLINFNPKTLEATPGLATKWVYSTRKTLILTLRKGVKFQDGTPFNAAAVKFSIDRARTLTTSTVKSDLASITSVEVRGPLKVVLHLNKPDASLVLAFADRAGMIVSPAAVTKWGTSFGQHPVGTGPFDFVSYQPGNQMIVNRNPHYWQTGLPYLNQITFNYFTNQQTEDNALKSHQADIELNVPAADVSALKSVSGLTVVSHASLSTDGCYINATRPVMSNVRVREAIASAIDRRSLSALLTFGLASPTSQVFPSGYWAQNPKLINPYQYNVDRAKSLLTQAGYPNGLSIKVLAFNAQAEIRRAQIIQQQLKAVGINMSLDVSDIPTVATDFFVQKTADMVCSNWSGRPDPSATANSLFGSKSFYNAGAYSPPGMAGALFAAASAPTQAKRAAAFSTINSINQKYVVWLPLLSQPINTAFYTDVQGFVPNLYGKVDVSFLSRS